MMKKKILNKTMRDSLWVLIGVFIIWFFLTLICGKPRIINPSRAATKCEPITFGEAIKEIPSLLFVAVGCGIFYFPIGYSYNKSKMEKQVKREEELSESEIVDKEEDNSSSYE